MITAAPHSPVLSDPVNLRDLGGITGADGPIAHGFAIRSDDLALISPSYAEQLVAEGLSAVIDLRSHAELRVTGRGPLAEQPVSFHHVPFLASIDQPAAFTLGADGLPDMHAMYVSLFETVAPSMVTALSIIAHSQGAVAFHCAAGRDRTGVLAAALLLALGVGDEAIVADYNRTHENIAGILVRTQHNLRGALAGQGINIDELQRSAHRFDGSDDAMRRALASLRARHGDPLLPLRAAGLNERLIAQLRDRARWA